MSVGEDRTTEVEVHLTARDPEGQVFFDKMARHVFRIENGVVTRFDSRDD